MADVAAAAAAKRPFDECRLAVLMLRIFFVGATRVVMRRTIAGSMGGKTKKPGSWPGCSLEVTDAYAAAGIAVSASRTSRMNSKARKPRQGLCINLALDVGSIWPTERAVQGTGWGSN